MILLVLLLCSGFTPSRSAFAQDPIPTAPVISAVGPIPFEGWTSPLFSGCGLSTPPASTNPAYEQGVLDLTNTERNSRGLPPLKRVTPLDNAARYQALDLRDDNYFDHDSYDRLNGSLTWVCAWSERVNQYYPGWSSLAENIAAGYANPASVLAGWMGSSGHRANILSSSVWEIGVGYSSGGGYDHYWVQDFGRRNGIYPLILNRDAATTASRNGMVYIYGSFDQMRLKNDSGAFGVWQTFTNSFPWTLPCSVGLHTVSAELKTGVTVYTSSDSIQLTVSGCPTLAGLPDKVTFLYSKSQAKLSPPSYILTPTNLTGTEALTWTIIKSGSWFSAAPLNGTTPASFTITPGSIASLAAGTYTGSVNLTVTSPTNTEGSPKTIQVDLLILNGDLNEVMLPVIRR
jgi:uncharacterized protein YkwD